MKRDALEKLVNRAIELHRAGNLLEARRLYEQALKVSPKTADLWYILGKIALQEGKNREAISHIQKAVDINGKNAQYHASLAVAYQNIAMNDDAIRAGLRAKELDPVNIVALNVLGNAYAGKKDFETAERYFLDLLNLNPNLSEVRINLGNLYVVQGRHDLAAREYEAGLSLKPEQTEVLRKLGKAYLMIDKLKDASDAFLKAQKLDSGSLDGYLLLGEALLGQKNYDAAAECFRQALILKPDSAVAYIGAGKAAAGKEQFDDAIALFTKAIELNPQSAEAFLSMGNALRDSGKQEYALSAYHEALKIRPDFAEVYYNLSNAYYDMNCLEEAEDNCNRALVLKPDLPEAHYNLAWILLSRGDYERGWQKYEWRLKKKDVPVRNFPFPRWNGSTLYTKRLLVLAEQGVGDEIMFSSCFAELAAQTDNCVVECDRRLLSIFSRSFPSFQFIERFSEYSPEMGKFDFYIECGSLPRFLRTDISHFPMRHSYLVPDNNALKRWQERYQDLGDGMNVGISWRGGKGYVKRLRSMPLDLWEGIFSLPGVHFINLQYGDCTNEIQQVKDRFGIVIHDWEDSDPMKDLDDFAAKVAALDLVISVDNSTVHMAGALGQLVWTMLPAAADWRWVRGVNDTPWYKTMVLFWQKLYGEWVPVFNKIREFLKLSLNNGDLLQENMYCPRSSELQKHALPRDRWTALLNDTSYWYHWGCTGTSSAIIDELQSRGYRIDRIPIQAVYRCQDIPQTLDDFMSGDFFDSFLRANEYIMSQLKQSDVVVLNGEGSLHGFSDNVRSLLYMAYTAKHHFGKEVHIINHSCYPENSLNILDSPAWQAYRMVYLAADSIAVREPLSFRLMQEAGIPAVQSFDCLPLFVKRHYKKRPKRKSKQLLIAGSVAWRDESLIALVTYIKEMRKQGFSISMLFGANLMPAADDITFIDAFKKACPDGWHLIKATTIFEWLNAIAEATILVSGRFHHSIAAWCLGTPFLLLDSNTPKNRGLSEILHVPPPLPHGLPALSERLLIDTESILKEPLDVDREIKIADYCALAMQNFAGIRSDDIYK